MSAIAVSRNASIARPRSVKVDRRRELVLFVFRAGRRHTDGNIISAAMYPARRGVVIAVWIGTRELTFATRDIRSAFERLHKFLFWRPEGTRSCPARW